MEDCTEAFDNNLQLDTMYLDFRKASDSFPHKCLFLELYCILFKKLERYRITGNLLNRELSSMESSLNGIMFYPESPKRLS